MKIVECAHCGNQAMMLVDSGVPMICCGEEMQELKAGVKDAALEKHVPAVTVNGSEMQVQVGEVAHPMTEEHSIRWIMLQQGDEIQLEQLPHTGEPKATFTAKPGPYAVYEFCNLHGLWKAEGKA